MRGAKSPHDAAPRTCRSSKYRYHRWPSAGVDVCKRPRTSADGVFPDRRFHFVEPRSHVKYLGTST
eukprot:5992323-Pyramimonas_sp.AAC.1